MSPPLEAAMRYAGQLQWRVFPTVGKTPIKGSRGHLDATTDPETIRRWWRDYPEANVAVATGEASGFWVLDIDERKGGEDSLDDLLREHGPLPETVEALTGGGGRHLLFRHVDGVRSRAVARVGIDVRGVGGYIVAAPSIHPDTRRPYCWEVDHHPLDVPIAQAPPWLIDLVRHRAQPAGPTAPAGPSPSWLELALGPVAEGQRNDTLVRLAGCLLRRWVEPRLVLTLLAAWNHQHCHPPLPQNELLRTVNSVLALETARRRNASS